MSSLNPNANYEELVSVRLVGMMLTVIVRQELRKNVLRYSTQTVGTGALNFMVILICAYFFFVSAFFPSSENFTGNDTIAIMIHFETFIVTKKN